MVQARSISGLVGTNCRICFSDFEPDQHVTTHIGEVNLAKMHAVHTKCQSNWVRFAGNNKCGTCRLPYSNDILAAHPPVNLGNIDPIRAPTSEIIPVVNAVRDGLPVDQALATNTRIRHLDDIALLEMAARQVMLRHEA